MCWYARCRTTAAVVNNPLHFWGELSALKGFDEKTIKGKHSSSIQESGLRQAGWADALSCLARACEGATPSLPSQASAQVPTGGVWNGTRQGWAGRMGPLQWKKEAPTAQPAQGADAGAVFAPTGDSQSPEKRCN